VIGESDPATCAIFAAVARSGIHVVPTWRNHHVSVIHAADLADLLILAAERGRRLLPDAVTPSVQPGAEQKPYAQDQGPGNAAQGCYFAACGEDPTYADFGRMVGRALGRRRVLALHVGPAIVWAVAGVSYLISRLRGQAHYFDPDKAREARAGDWTCSAQAAQEDLGFRASVCLADRLRQTADWYRQNGWL
jgi:nucleoside-diphosphate-sugar epimerase